MDPPQTSILRFRFEDFIRSCYSSKLPGILADATATDEGGDNWRLLLRRSQEENRVAVSMALVKETPNGQPADDETTTKFTFIIRDRHEDVAHEESFLSSQSAGGNSGSSASMNMFTMSTFKVDDRILSDGTLAIDVAVQVLTETKTERSSRCNPFRENMLNLFRSGAKADVVFRIDDYRIRAHRFILENNAPALARLCDGNNDPVDRPVRLFGVPLEAFVHVLRYVYGGDAPATPDAMRLGRDVIAICYRFGQPRLREEVERALVGSCVVDASNCVEYILFAERNKCPSLKSHAISYLLARPRDVLDVESFELLKDNLRLMREIMLAMAGNSKHAGGQKRTIGWRRGGTFPSGWRTQIGRRRSPTKQKKVRSQKKAAVDVRQDAPSNDLQSVYERACVGGTHGHSELVHEKIRRDAKKLLEAAEYGGLQKPRSYYMQKHGNNRWIVGT